MSGINSQIWDSSYNTDNAPKTCYIIGLNGVIINNLSPNPLWGAGISYGNGSHGFQLIISAYGIFGCRYWYGSYDQWYKF